MSRTLKAVAIGAAISMYLVLIMGTWVTNSNSSQGCGRSWPLCNGRFMPLADYHALVEFSHRAVTGAASIFVVALVVMAWRAMGRQPLVRLLSWLAVGFLLIQAALGALAVLWPQPKWVLAAHFGISLVSFGSVLLLAVLVFQAGRPAVAARRPAEPLLRTWVWYVTAFTYVVVYLGAYVRHIGASAACQGWPLCNDALIPSLTGATGASFAHRIAAVIVFFLVLRLAVLVQRYAAERPDLLWGGRAAALLVTAQVFSGMLLATGSLNVPTMILHSAILCAFFGVLSYLCLQTLPAAAPRPVPAHA